MDFVVRAVVIGLTEHAPLVLAAIGFALLYRLTGLINVAYSETITLGAYFGMWANTTFGLNFYAVLLPAGLLAGLVSVATYLLIFRPAKRRNVGVLEMIIISFGLSILLRHGLQFVFGYPVRFFDVPPPDPRLYAVLAEAEELVGTESEIRRAVREGTDLVDHADDPRARRDVLASTVRVRQNERHDLRRDWNAEGRATERTNQLGTMHPLGVERLAEQRQNFFDMVGHVDQCGYFFLSTDFSE